MLKRNSKFTFVFIITIVLVLGVSISLQSLLAAWTAPTNNPPLGNIAPPIYNKHTTPDVAALINLPLTINDAFYAGVKDFYVEKNLGTETLGERGYVGIGTLSPQAELHIASDSGDPLFLDNRNYTALRIENMESTDSIWELRAHHNDIVTGLENDFAIWGGSETNEAYRIIIKGDPGINLGNVGINDFNPAAKLNILNDGAALSFLVEDDIDGDATPFVIDEDGNVGIKKINPGYELDVAGEIHSTGDICTDMGGIVCLSTAGGGGDFWTENGTNDIYNNNTGNVGIRTTNPNAKLEINMGNSAAEGLHISRTAFGANSYFNIEDELNNPIFKVHENGNAGVGTNDPQAKLHIRQNDLGIDWSLASAKLKAGELKVEGLNARINLIGKDESTFSSYLKMSEVDASGDYLNSWVVWRETSNIGSSFAISHAEGAESFSDEQFIKLTIQPNGDVGIGTTNPTVKLDVNGAIKGSDYYSGDGSQGLTRAVTVKGSDGNNCVLTFKDGLLTNETCP